MTEQCRPPFIELELFRLTRLGAELCSQVILLRVIFKILWRGASQTISLQTIKHNTLLV